MPQIGDPFDERWVVGRLLESRAAETPAHPLMHWEGRDHTYDEMNRAANRVAAGLAARGLGHGDRVAVMMQSAPAYLSVWFGATKLGAVEVPINTAYKGDLLAHILNSAGASIAVVDAEFVPAIQAIEADCPALAQVIVNGSAEAAAGLAAESARLADIETGDGANPERAVAATDMACILFTSGTTGPSKGVIVNHAFELSFSLVFNDIVALTGDDVTYNFLPFFHIAGKFVLLSTMITNGRMLLRPRFSVERFWDDVRAHGVTVTVAVGGICHMLYAQPRRTDDADNPLRMIYSVPNPHDVLDDFKARFGVELTEGYGSTEANIVAYTRPGEATPQGSCGRAGPAYEVRVVDENDRPVPPGTSGEIVVRPKHANILMEGYYGLPEKSIEAFRSLWFHSGDRGVMDENGYLFFLDRMKDAIRRRGENISSFEVERIINKHDEVAEVAAVALPAEIGEDEVKVVVVRTPGTTLGAEALLRYCVDEMPYFMVPRFIEFKDDLPRTPTQKVRKTELRAEAITPATWDSERAGFKVTRSGLEEPA